MLEYNEGISVEKFYPDGTGPLRSMWHCLQIVWRRLTNKIFYFIICYKI